PRGTGHPGRLRNASVRWMERGPVVGLRRRTQSASLGVADRLASRVAGNGWSGSDLEDRSRAGGLLGSVGWSMGGGKCGLADVVDLSPGLRLPVQPGSTGVRRIGDCKA